MKTYVCRAGGVMPGDGYDLITRLLPAVSLRMLAAVMADLAVNGGSEQVLSNALIVERGRQLLAKEK